MHHKWSNNTLAWIFLILLSIIWGGSCILMKKALRSFDSTDIVFLRIFWGFIPLTVFAYKSIQRLTFKDFLITTLIGFMGTFIPMFGWANASNNLPSSLNGLLSSLSPVCVIIIGNRFFHKKISKNELIGIMCGLVGSSIILLNEFVKGDGVGFNIFIPISMGCFFLYAISANFIVHFCKHIKSIDIVSSSFIVMGIISTIYCAMNANRLVDIVNNSQYGYTSLVYMIIAGVVNLALANFLYTTIVELKSPIFASIETIVSPFVATLLGLLDGESLHINHYVGGIIIIFGIYFINKGK